METSAEIQPKSTYDVGKVDIFKPSAEIRFSWELARGFQFVETPHLYNVSEPCEPSGCVHPKHPRHFLCASA
jgi:hypothetical protein